MSGMTPEESATEILRGKTRVLGADGYRHMHSAIAAAIREERRACLRLILKHRPHDLKPVEAVSASPPSYFNREMADIVAAIRARG